MSEIKNNTNLDELYTLGRKARIEGDYEKAREVYERIDKLQPDKWESVFYGRYTTYFDYWSYGDKKDRDDRIGELWNVIAYTLKLIAQDNTIDKMAAVVDIKHAVDDVHDRYLSSMEHLAEFYESMRMDKIGSYDGDDYLARVDSTKESLERTYLGGSTYRFARMLYQFGDDIFTNGLQDIRIESQNKTLAEAVSVDCWKKGNHMIWFAYMAMSSPIVKESKQFIAKYTELIRRYDPNYQPPDLPKKAKSGCYVATCVYGSYDCPRCGRFAATATNAWLKASGAVRLYLFIMR